MLARPHGADRRLLAGALVALPAGLAAGAVATQTLALPIALALTVGLAAVALARSPWLAPLGLASVVLLPANAYAVAHFHGVSPWLAVSAYTLAVALIAAFAAARLADFDLRAASALAVFAGVGVASAVVSGSGVRFPLYLAGLSLGAYLLGGLSARHADAAAIRIGLALAPCAALNLYEGLHGQNVWAQVIGPLDFQTFGPFRATSTFGHPLVAGAVLVTVGVLLLAQRRPAAMLLGAGLVLAASASVSRSSLVGVLVGLAILAVQRRRRLAAPLAVAVVASIGVVLVFHSIPILGASLDQRVAHAEPNDSRIGSWTRLESDVTHKPLTLLVAGGGLGSSAQQLTAVESAYQPNTYDNQYITLIYDLGGAATLIVAWLLLAPIQDPRRAAGRWMLPALAALAAMMLLYDGLYWVSTGAIFWYLVGAMTAPGPARPGPSEAPRPTALRELDADGSA